MSLRALLAAALTLPLPALAAAQEASHVSVMAGVTEFDLSGVGTTGIYAVRADVPVWPNLLLEGSLSYARLDQQFGRSDLFIPEAQVQLQGTWGRFSPYVGLGGGAAVDVPQDDALETDTDFAPSVAAGARVAVAMGVGVRVEGRIHGIEADFTGTVSELTAGFSVAW